MFTVARGFAHLEIKAAGVRHQASSVERRFNRDKRESGHELAIVQLRAGKIDGPDAIPSNRHAFLLICRAN